MKIYEYGATFVFSVVEPNYKERFFKNLEDLLQVLRRVILNEKYQDEYKIIRVLYHSEAYFECDIDPMSDDKTMPCSLFTLNKKVFVKDNKNFYEFKIYLSDMSELIEAIKNCNKIICRRK